MYNIASFSLLFCRSPAEAGMEKAIADIFTEVRARKVVAAKRGAIK